jgi:hypothetical protein
MPRSPNRYRTGPTLIERLLAGAFGSLLGGFVVLSLIFFAGMPGAPAYVVGPVAVCGLLAFLAGGRGLRSIARFMNWCI